MWFPRCSSEPGEGSSYRDTGVPFAAWLYTGSRPARGDRLARKRGRDEPREVLPDRGSSR